MKRTTPTLYTSTEMVGIHEEREEGEAGGELKAQRRIAQELMLRDYPSAEIAEITGLPLAEIEKFAINPAGGCNEDN